VATVLKLQQLVINKPVRSRHRAAIQQICQHRLKQARCTRSTLWRHHYVTTSKECL